MAATTELGQLVQVGLHRPQLLVAVEEEGEVKSSVDVGVQVFQCRPDLAAVGTQVSERDRRLELVGAIEVEPPAGLCLRPADPAACRRRVGKPDDGFFPHRADSA